MLIFIIKSKSKGGISNHIKQLNKGLLTFGYSNKVYELNFKLINLFKTIIKIRKDCKKKSPDIIHFHGYRAMLISPLLPKNTRKVCTIHGYLQTGNSLSTQVIKRFLLLLGDNMDKYICVSNTLKETFMQEFGISENKIVVIHNGIEISNFKKQRKATATVIGACGRLISIKGYDLLIKAFNKIRSKYNVKLHIIGDGPDMGRLKKLAHADVYFHGFVKYPQEIMKDFDVFVQPSLFEGCGISVLEAMSMNLPVIVSDSGGLPELVKHNENGLVFKKGCIEDLTKYLEAILSPGIYRTLGVENRERVIKKFSHNKMLLATINTYQDLMGETIYEKSN